MNATVETELDEAQKVFANRMERVLHAGFDVHGSELLAASDAVVAEVERAISQGCTAKLALRIYL